MQCLNGLARRTVVESAMDKTCASIVCTLETKLVVTQSVVMETLSMDFDAYFCLSAIDTRGGIIVAWINSLVQLDSAHVDVYSVTVG
jgi:hypothetical protein